jgi:hypothetical protein
MWGGGPRPARAADAGDQTDRYGLVLLLLLTGYALSAFLVHSRVRLVTLAVFGAALLMALRTARPPAAVARRLRWALLAGSVAATAATVLLPGRVGDGLTSLWIAVVLVLTVAVVVRRILRHRVVTMQTIFGALCAYLLVGFTFAALFTAADAFDPEPFFAGGEATTPNAMQYFSFVTLTTTGYGDLTAASNSGRALAVLDALLGQILLVTLVARLVAVYGTERPRQEPSPDPDGADAADGPTRDG